MSAPEPQIRDFEELFVDELEAVYDMELKLVDALAEQSRTVADDNLEKGFAVHRTETERQVENVEAAFEALGRDPTRRTNPIVDGLLAETERVATGVTDDALLNVHYLTAAIATERLEISSYEGLLVTAKQAELGDAVTDPLRGNLEQEEKTLRKLRGLAGEPGLDSLWKRLTGS